MRIAADRAGAATVRMLRRFPGSHGDVWAPTWADDGHLYVVSDDTEGFDGACSSNVAVHRVTGDSVDELRGETVNGMPEFGAFMQTGPDGATWKGTGLVCVDGVLHLAASRHRYGVAPYFIQQTWDSVILSSHDHGKTWEGSLERPLFAGRGFANPNFVQVGRDGGDVDHVYALSNDATWNNGTSMTLGRFPRGADPRDPSRWTFWLGDGKWGADPSAAGIVLRGPGRTGMAGATWIDALGVYCLPQWYYEFLDRDHQRSGDWTETISSTPTRLEFFTALEPWGPWISHGAVLSEAEGWYNPGILAKPLEGVPDGTVPFFAAGLGGGRMEHYNLNLLALDLGATG